MFPGCKSRYRLKVKDMTHIHHSFKRNDPTHRLNSSSFLNLVIHPQSAGVIRTSTSLSGFVPIEGTSYFNSNHISEGAFHVQSTMSGREQGTYPPNSSYPMAKPLSDKDLTKLLEGEYMSTCTIYIYIYM